MDEIASTRRRTLAYWLTDGIAEIVGGATLALVGALFIAASYAERTAGDDTLGSISLLVMIVAFPASAAVVRLLKERLTYPRTGYVRYPEKSTRRRALAGVVAFAVAALMGLVVIGRSIPPAFMVQAFGVAMAAAFGVHAFRVGMPRLYLRAIVALLVAIFLAPFARDLTGGLGLLFVPLGLASVVTGVWGLAEYLRDNPRSDGEAA